MSSVYEHPFLEKIAIMKISVDGWDVDFSSDDDDEEESNWPPGPQEERRIISQLMKDTDSNVGEEKSDYIISAKWWRDWLVYTRGDKKDSRKHEHSIIHKDLKVDIPQVPCRPGKIDNSDLILNGTDGDSSDLLFHEKVLKGCDHVLVPRQVWKKLLKWYEGGPELPKELIYCSINKSFSTQDNLQICVWTDGINDIQSTIKISKEASVMELYNRVCSLFDLEEDKIRIWDYRHKKKGPLLNKSNLSLEEANLIDQDILLEVEVDGVWPSDNGANSMRCQLALVPTEPSCPSATIAGSPFVSDGYSTPNGPDLSQTAFHNSYGSNKMDLDELLITNTEGVGRGLIGLLNLGNTCFMNSAIQCLGHTPPLVEYFLKDYKKEINEQNPLGLKGELAIAFGELLRKLWSSQMTVIKPDVFKGNLVRFAPHFSGFNQHDSQELLAFLLDGLHEDLNCVKDKAYTVIKDMSGHPDEEVADQFWKNHKARNDSIIVDIFQGQYKSTLECTACRNVSITFDPFMHLSLPLPVKATRTMTVTVFHCDGREVPRNFTVTVPKHGSLKDLTQALSTVCCLKINETLLLAEVLNHHICRYLEDPSESLSSIMDDDVLVAYRLPIQYKKLQRLEILHRKRARYSQSIQNYSCMVDRIPGYRPIVGIPLVTCLAEGIPTEADVRAAVGAMLAPLLRRRDYFLSSQAENIKENDLQPVVDDDDKSIASDQSSCPMGHAISNREPEHTSNGESLQLWLIDTFGIYPIENLTLSSYGSREIIKVFLDWSDREVDMYDTEYLECLPWVGESFSMITESVSLFSCFEAFLKEEPLGEDDMWYCPTCKEHRKATKKLDLWRLPDILVVHVKRFSYGQHFTKDKLDAFVDFPITNLDLSSYVKCTGVAQSHTYGLYAVINHYGFSCGGHYTAYSKLIEEDKWYHFDDDLVTPVNENNVKSSAAYVLFYRRVKCEVAASAVSEPSQLDSLTP